MEQTAITIVKDLREAGYEAYFAGGCVRDILMKHEPNDYDIVTSAKPEEIEEVLKHDHIIPVGKQFGVILVIKNNHHFEIATFRSDSGYSDGRRPDYVTYASAEKDAFRRDFSVNGMFYDPVTEEIIDYVKGKNDLNEKIIRFIGNPETRIKEDNLRILRAIRFRNRFDFQFEPETYKSLQEFGALAKNVSQERIRDELNKIMKLKHVAKAFNDLEDLQILKHILPEVLAMKGVAQPTEYHQEGDVWEHTFKALSSVSTKAPLEVRWAVLLHDVGKPETFKVEADRIHFDGHAKISAEIAKTILKRLQFSTKFIANVYWLIEHHMMMLPFKNMTSRRKWFWYSKPQFNNLLRLCRADIKGSKPRDFSLYRFIRNDYLAMKKEMKKRKALEIKPLLQGRDLIKKFKMLPGPEMGKILAQVEHEHLEETIHTKKEAYELVEKMLNKEFK